MLVAVEKRSEKGKKTVQRQLCVLVAVTDYIWRFQLTQFIKQMALGFFVAVENY